jgi:signal transduction histidine kinase
MLIGRLVELVQRILQDLDLTSVLQAIVEAGMELADGDAGAVSLEQRPGTFVRMANVNIPDDLASQPVTPGEGLHGTVLVSGQPISIDDYDSWPGGVASFQGRGFHASLAVPIVRDDRVIGALAVHSTTSRRRFGQADLDILVLLAEYAAVAIGNATTYRRVNAERERFLALVEAIPDGLAVVEQGRVTAWNAAAARLTGRPAVEVLGGPAPFDLDAATTGLERAGHDGRLHWIETVGSPLATSGGHVYLIRDMTEQRDLERAKELFFASTSHELKTPLTVVRGLASTLRHHWQAMTDEQRSETLETVERRAESLDRLIERILVGSRVRAGGFEVVAIPVDVGRLITDIVAGFAAASPGHLISAQLPTELPLVSGDRQAIDTILGHLLENAIKYSPGGGEVDVVASVDSGWVLIDVLDRGVGLEGDVKRLLDPFVQSDTHKDSNAGGVGLGLYIVRQLVAALGGHLAAANRDGGGASFTFSLPIWR